ncbi:hypothetical protein RJT34_16199 [Clitoria ternatea]|uniref:Uncharacterized protein n=1 Tax=Clitoria ternatea TaxID=43366 RepID=A0AAN9J820_CLITE
MHRRHHPVRVSLSSLTDLLRHMHMILPTIEISVSFMASPLKHSLTQQKHLDRLEIRNIEREGDKKIEGRKEQVAKHRELEIRNKEKNMNMRSAKAANKQYMEGVKKIAKLEVEC